MREHPWLPADAGDDTDDIGDPRDMTVPRVRRGMTVRDEAAWAAEVNAAGKADGARQTGTRMLMLGTYATTAAHMERIIGLGTEPEHAFLCTVGMSEGACGILRDFWIYGERFWAWWQGRQKPIALGQAATAESEIAHVAEGWRVSPISPRADIACFYSDEHGASCVRVPTHLATCATAGRYLCDEHVNDQRCYEARVQHERLRDVRIAPMTFPVSDPRPVLTLGDGTTVRADEVWEFTDGSAAAMAGDVGYSLSSDAGRWSPSNMHWSDANAGKGNRVYPPAEAKPTTNAHGVDVGKIRAGDFVRCERGEWRVVTTLQPESRCISGRILGTDACYWTAPESSITDHRPAPRIVLPDGREVAPERMYRDSGGEYANVEGDGWSNPVNGRGWARTDPGNPWADDESGDRVWPPADVEGA